MRRLPLRNSPATLVEHGGSLSVEAPDQQRYAVDMGVLTLTSRCNLACAMCLEPRDPGPADLPFDEAMAFVEVFAGRVSTIWTCAGEALLYPRFFEIAQAISRRGTRTGVGTNGIALAAPDVVARCAEVGIWRLHVSCHTSRRERFVTLMGARGPRLFDDFVRGLQNIDAWNRDHDRARRMEVLLQLVLMRPLADELDEYLDFVARHLSHSPLVIRVEPMLQMNAARQHPELEYDVVELGGIVRSLVDRHSARFHFEFKGVPLCMLAGSEGTSEDLRWRAAGAVVVGNVGRQSGELQLQCSIGDPAHSSCAGHCAGCSVVSLCPGVMENVVPPGSPWPSARSESPVELLARLGLRTDFAHRKFSLEYPRHSTGPDPDAPAPTPRPEPAQAPAESIDARLAPGTSSIDPEAAERFTPSQLDRLRQLVEALQRARVLEESKVCDRFAALRLRSEAPGTVVVCQPPGPSTPSYFVVAGIAVRYHGVMTPALRLVLEQIRLLLARSVPIVG